MRGSLILGPWAHDELAGGVAPNNVKFVEAFGGSGPLEALERADDGGNRDSRLARALGILAEGVTQWNIEKIADNAKSRVARGLDIDCSLGRQDIGVIDHERLGGGEADAEKLALARARFQLVETDAAVRGGKALLVEGAFAGALDSDEDDGFHTRCHPHDSACEVDGGAACDTIPSRGSDMNPEKVHLVGSIA